MRQWIIKFKDESASAIIENVIILPLIFILIYSIILTVFMIHDRSTVDAAARRGVIYASHCISDSAYASILGQTGELDIAQETDVQSFSFSGVAKNIKMYSVNNVEALVEKEVRKIVDNTRIPWRKQETVSVTCEQKNMFLYQDITVTVKSSYSIPAFFAAFGLDPNYEYTATAKLATTNPDEFIRNADLVVDLIADIDDATGGHIQNALDKIGELGTKIVDWLQVDK